MSSLEDLLARARERIDRVEPAAALEELRAGAVLVDIRLESQIARDGTVPGAIVVPRNILEWRCAPDGDHRDPRLSDPGGRLIVMCDGGYQSSLAAATLRELGLRRAADLAGGFQAWKAAGLPVAEPHAKSPDV
jgi:rhodanese-related sulfurtransferase